MLKEKVLVLGSSGQIGRFVVKKFVSMGHNVETFDVAISPEMDLRKFKNVLLKKKISEADLVIFLACDVGGSSYLSKWQDSFGFISNNVRIMENVFSLCLDFDKKILFSSSTMASVPHSTYGRLKLLGESYTKSVGGIYSKLWNIYGLESEQQKFHVISDLIHKAITTGKISLMTDGEEERQFLYGSDCADAFYSLFENYDNLCKEISWDISGFEWIKIKEVAKEVAVITGIKDIQFSEQKDVIQGVKHQPGEHIKDLWQPKIDLRTGISMLYDDMVRRMK